MRGVSTLEDACAAARELLEQGVGCIELCGAFGPDGARRIIEATGNRIPVGYVTHLPEQEAVYRAACPMEGRVPRSARPGVGAALLGRTPACQKSLFDRLGGHFETLKTFQNVA